ncbi:unnamed protein product [Lactuca saligna]|uniref:Uncharacterized protein n=1 Tax=Lactuca saligna TaxID=75948 RepID=A0AA36E5R1_LACSI|nr:unnamed protein product [Lactuca saligna]
MKRGVTSFGGNEISKTNSHHHIPVEEIATEKSDLLLVPSKEFIMRDDVYNLEHEEHTWLKMMMFLTELDVNLKQMIKDADLLFIEEANIEVCYKLKINQKVEVVKVKCHKVKIGVRIFHGCLILGVEIDYIL